MAISLIVVQLKRHSLLFLFCLFSFPNMVLALPIIGTNGNDLLFMTGALQPVSTTITNPYSGASVSINGTYFVSPDTYDGLAGVDSLFMTNQDDMILPETGGVQTLASVERLIAGDGNDIIHLASTGYTLGSVFIDGGRGNDIIWSNAGDDTVRGFDGDDLIDGGAGNDTLLGQNDNDTLSGGSGINILDGGAGTDTALFLGQPFSYYSLDTNGGIFINDPLNANNRNTLISIEFARFSDGTLRLSDFSYSGTSVPEPSTMLLLVIGLLPFLFGQRVKDRPTQVKRLMRGRLVNLRCLFGLIEPVQVSSSPSIVKH